MQGSRQERLSTDLKLMRQMTAESIEAGWPRPRNMAQLATLLRFKNSPSNFPSQQVERGRSWLRNQGVDIENIYNKLERGAGKQASRGKGAHQDTYFYVDLSLQSLPEYLEKSYEYSTMSLIQHVMTRNSSRQRRFIGRAVDSLLSPDNNKFTISWASERVPEQREVYIRAVRNIVRRDKEEGAMMSELLREFKVGFSHHAQHTLWDILSEQLSRYNPERQLRDNLGSLYLASLRLVEECFQKRMHGQDIDRYLSSTYLHRIYGNSCEQKETLWAKVWVLMMAGQHRQALELIATRYKNYTELIHAYSKAHEAINNNHPLAFKLQPRPDIRDIFYLQVLHCLNGESKYSSEALFEKHSLEVVWMLLRSTGIFCESGEKMEKGEALREGVVGSYKDCTSDPQLVRNMLYLLDYEGVVRLGPNVLINQDDYLHLLLVLNQYPQLIQQPQLEKLLIAKLGEAIIELMVERREEYAYYIALLPAHAVVPEVSSIIISSEALDSINWKLLQELLPAPTYLALVKTTVARLVSVRGDYLRGAEKLMELAHEPLLAMEYLVSMLVKSNLGSQSFSQEQVLRAEELGGRLSEEQEPYEQIFELLASSRQLRGLLLGRQEGALQHFISNNQLIFLDGQATLLLARALQRLAELGGAAVYFNFLRNAVKATEICTVRAGRLGELRNFKALLLNTCLRLLEHPKLAACLGESGVEDLLAYLRLPY